MHVKDLLCVFFIGGIYSIARTNMITIIKRSWARVRNDNDDEMIYMGVGSCLLLNKFSFIIFLFYDIPSDACFVNILHRVNGQQNNSRLGETTQAIIKIINQSCMIFCREREIAKEAKKKQQMARIKSNSSLRCIHVYIIKLVVIHHVSWHVSH